MSLILSIDGEIDGDAQKILTSTFPVITCISTIYFWKRTKKKKSMLQVSFIT